MPVPGGRGRRKTLDLNSGSGIARSVYASLLAHLGRTSEANSEITPGARRRAVLARGQPRGDQCHVLLQAVNEAFAQGIRNVEMFPTLGYSYCLLGVAYGHASRPEEALKAFQTATDLGIGTPMAEWGRAFVHILKGETAQALKVIEVMRSIVGESYVSPLFHRRALRHARRQTSTRESNGSRKATKKGTG